MGHDSDDYSAGAARAPRLVLPLQEDLAPWRLVSGIMGVPRWAGGHRWFSVSSTTSSARTRQLPPLWDCRRGAALLRDGVCEVPICVIRREHGAGHMMQAQQHRDEAHRVQDFRLDDDELANNLHRDPRILLGRQKLNFALKLFNLGLDAEAFQLPKLEIELKVKEGSKTDTTDQNADCRGIKRPTSELEEAGQDPKRQKVEERLPQFLPLGDGKPSSKLEDWEDEASK
ncbi:hypothetical protein WOLCODRAFT_158821 [Wolfiporia cocos MD-104 SS10]|uniref:Uncharacterized protein n=1 Tax=Wolfiporia cocos (strain MD-104) TaxID=742152 RepID=A0A2H3JCF6_WOLCO|nr:hypothetical protein WOLCODRAFT_158821 [Wolfiporia cocos MD-104 SS10]